MSFEHFRSFQKKILSSIKVIISKPPKSVLFHEKKVAKVMKVSLQWIWTAHFAGCRRFTSINLFFCQTPSTEALVTLDMALSKVPGVFHGDAGCLPFSLSTGVNLRADVLTLPLCSTLKELCQVTSLSPVELWSG